jgi:hypothetical protein
LQVESQKLEAIYKGAIGDMQRQHEEQLAMIKTSLA